MEQKPITSLFTRTLYFSYCAWDLPLPICHTFDTQYGEDNTSNSLLGDHMSNSISPQLQCLNPFQPLIKPFSTWRQLDAGI
jgi:hypothetical protein